MQRVEVLKDVDWWHLHRKVMSSHNDVDVRSRLVLQACPYLQHLDLAIDSLLHLPPHLADTFALVPHLRSLHLSQVDVDERTGPRLAFDFRAMLASLSRLTSLRCSRIHVLAIADLLDFACHSTLEELHIDSDGAIMADGQWIGWNMRFPVSVEDDERALAQPAKRDKLDGDIEEESEAVAVDDASDSSSQLTGTSERASVLEEVEEEMQRMVAALYCTSPLRTVVE